MQDYLKEKMDRWATTFATITAIPVFGVIIKMVFDKITEKGVKKLHERIEKILGFDVEDAKKDVTDEILYGVAVAALDEPEQDEVDAFEESLRNKDAKKAEAFVLYIAKIIKTFEREDKKVVKPKKGENGPSIEQVYKNIEDGIGHAKKFLRILLRKTDVDKNATFDARVKFLQGKNVFSLIKEEKDPSLKGFADFLKMEGAKGLEKVKRGNSDVATATYRDNAQARLKTAKERSNARRRILR